MLHDTHGVVPVVLVLRKCADHMQHKLMGLHEPAVVEPPSDVDPCAVAVDPHVVRIGQHSKEPVVEL
eukprot:4575837-Ditylum_brightwellii.AAC.1